MLPRLTSAIAILVFATPVAAQGWVDLPAVNNTPVTSAQVLNPTGRAFFNNSSLDGANCGLVGVVRGIAGTPAAPCANQRPIGWLPFTGGTPDKYLGGGLLGGNPFAARAFLFAPGTYSFTQLPGLGGDIAGMDRRWGVFELTEGDEFIDTEVAGTSLTKTFGRRWGFFIDAMLPGDDNRIVRSRSIEFAQHFALLGSGVSNSILREIGGLDQRTLVDPVVGQNFVVGMEDKGCRVVRRDFECVSGIDFDNNDVIVTFAPVPEPGTYALMATGLAVLGAVARRRRAAA